MVDFKKSLQFQPSLTSSKGCFEGFFRGEWSQGRTAYGGLVASRAAGLIFNHLKDGFEITNLQVMFLGPIIKGSVTAEYHSLREGRTTHFHRVELFQSGKLTTVIHGVSRIDTGSKLSIKAPATTWVVEQSDNVESLPYIEGITPQFTRFLEYRFVYGGLPFTGDASNVFRGYVRHRTDFECEFQSVLALFDAWPGPCLNRLSAPAPASSVTWNIDILQPLRSRQQQFWFLDVASDYASRGRAGSDSCLYDEQGELVLKGRQQIAVFD